MRPYTRLILATATTAAAALAGCDGTTSPFVAAVGGTTAANSADALVISPGHVSVKAGTTVQLSTNAPANLSSQVQWSSSSTTVATVSPSGLVNAVSAGSSVISARYTFDTTRVATAIVDVSGTTVP